MGGTGNVGESDDGLAVELCRNLELFALGKDASEVKPGTIVVETEDEIVFTKVPPFTRRQFKFRETFRRNFLKELVKRGFALGVGRLIIVAGRVKLHLFGVVVEVKILLLTERRRTQREQKRACVRENRGESFHREPLGVRGKMEKTVAAAANNVIIH